MKPEQQAGVLAHDWIERVGGSERVVEAISSRFPDLPLLTLWSNDHDGWQETRVVESPLARTPLRRSKMAALPFMSSAWRAFDLTDVEWALISSHAFAHHLGSGRRQRHVRRFIYVHTPARYLWARDLDPRSNGPVASQAAALLRTLDRRRVGPGSYAANSAFVRDRIRRAWDVDATVIHPPIAVTSILAVEDWRTRLSAPEVAVIESLPDCFLLGASRFVGYKNLDQVIDFGAHVGMPVVLAGSGGEEAALREHAAAVGVPVHFVLSPSDAMLRTLFQLALAYVYPPVEDFGMMPVEAYVLGTPAVVNLQGGAIEAATATGGGVACSFEDPSQWSEALRSAQALDSAGAAVLAARTFSVEAFLDQVVSWVEGPAVG